MWRAGVAHELGEVVRAAAVLCWARAVPKIGISQRAHRPTVDHDVGKVVVIVALPS